MFDRSKKQLVEKINIDFIQGFGKLDLKDGDIVILKTQRRLSKEAADGFMKWGESMLKDLPVKVKIALLEDGMDIGILRPEISSDKPNKQ
ncbi:MAG: hypothetical protein ABSB79_16250 [Syntrophales bacterium]|jgi:hypothetical protein